MRRRRGSEAVRRILTVLGLALTLPGSVAAQAELVAHDFNATGIADRDLTDSLRAAYPSPAQTDCNAEDCEIAPAARITIGPEGVGAHAQAYAIRSEVAGRALSVTFSATPVAQSHDQAIAGGSPVGSPVTGVVTSGFGPRMHPISGERRAHMGVDLAAREGSPVRATATGHVSTAGWAGGYGLLVTIEHGTGWQTRYGHMSRLNVRQGQKVAAGEVIGFVGSTGNSTGPHVHYETRRNGRAMVPELR